MRLQDMSWPAVAALGKDVPVVLPVAAVEQHGGHLPVFTDSLLLGEVVRRAEEWHSAELGGAEFKRKVDLPGRVRHVGRSPCRAPRLRVDCASFGNASGDVIKIGIVEL